MRLSERMDLKELESLYVEILENSQYLLAEMFVIGERENDGYVIAHKSKIWLLKSDIQKTSQEVLKDLENTFGYYPSKYETFDSFASIISNSNYGKNDVLFGRIDGKTMQVLDKKYPMIKSPEESNLFKKVVGELRPPRIEFESDVISPLNTGVKRFGKNDKLFYHGTSSTHLPNILRTGLDRNTANSNHGEQVKNIIKGQVFMTSNFRYAFQHAHMLSIKNKDYPVVVEMRIRFEDLLQPDYDVLRNNPDQNKAYKISKEMGIYGYKGNILPSDLFKIYFALNREVDIDRYNKEDIYEVGADMADHLINVKQKTLPELVEYNLK